MLHPLFRTTLYIILILLVLGVFLPNACNHREQLEFSGKNRKSGIYIESETTESVYVRLSDFYERNSLVTTLLGTQNRQLWSTPVWLPIFRFSYDTLTFTLNDKGGGQQTTSFNLLDNYGRKFTLRSVDKDQSKALPFWLRKTGIRTMFRDQASALNPYGAPVVSRLASMAGIIQLSPVLVFVPAGTGIASGENEVEFQNRIMLLEIEPDETWNSEPLTGESKIIDSDKLLKMLQQGEIRVDAEKYVYCRLFDMAIGDWDRHEGQWVWLTDSSKVAKPIPMDRDMAFYQFNDGLINQLAISVNPKFQSFDRDWDEFEGYFVNGKEIDSLILGNVDQQIWINQARKMQSQLTPGRVHEAFKAYPDAIYNLVGPQHEAIFNFRINSLDSIAAYLPNSLKY